MVCKWHIPIHGSIGIYKLKTSLGLNQCFEFIANETPLWGDLFANDGPKQCKFLKLKPLEGRSKIAFKHSVGWAFNLMNQPKLSELLFAASAGVLRHNEDPQTAFEQRFFNKAEDDILRSYRIHFLEAGLDGIDLKSKAEIQNALDVNGKFCEVHDWLNGKYLVGNECLTD